jgi:hypothetical protein
MEALSPDPHALPRLLWCADGRRRYPILGPSLKIVNVSGVNFGESDMTISDLNAAKQVVQIKHLLELCGIRPSVGCIGKVARVDLRRQEAIIDAGVDKCGSPYLAYPVSRLQVPIQPVAQGITDRYQGQIKGRDNLPAQDADNAGGVGDPDVVKTAAHQHERPQFVQGVTLSKDTDQPLGRHTFDERTG